MPTVDTHRLPALPTGDDQDVIRLGGRERIASNVFSAIRSAACTVTTQPGDGLAILPERTAMVLKEIVKGTACHINATAEDIFDLLAAFQIPVERALPVWPPLGPSDSKVGILAGGNETVSCETPKKGPYDGASLPSPDEVFIRIHAIKQTFDVNS